MIDANAAGEVIINELPDAARTSRATEAADVLIQQAVAEQNDPSAAGVDKLPLELLDSSHVKKRACS